MFTEGWWTSPLRLMEAHQAELAIQGEEAVDLKNAWADPNSGMMFRVSDEAVQRIHERAGHPADEIYEDPVGRSLCALLDPLHAMPPHHSHRSNSALPGTMSALLKEAAGRGAVVRREAA